MYFLSANAEFENGRAKTGARKGEGKRGYFTPTVKETEKEVPVGMVPVVVQRMWVTQ
jgi:hypothetical protein